MRAPLSPLAKVSGTGSYLPPNVVDNDCLAALVSGYDTARSGDFGAWVDQVTHVHERRFSRARERSSDLALHAAQRALDAAGIEASDLDMIVYATFTPSEMIPGDHCVLAQQLGATRAGVFMLMAACAGSIYGMATAWGMVTSGLYEHVLVVGAETASKALNFHDPITAIIFGDGAGAVVISRGDPNDEGGMVPPHTAFQYSARNIHLANSNVPVDVPAFPEMQLQPGVRLVEQSTVEMESGPTVLRSAVKSMAACTAKALGYEPTDLKKKVPELVDTIQRARIVPHQANGRILDGIAKELRIPQERVTRTLYRYGNISAASNLVALDFGLRHGNMVRVLDDEGLVVDVRTDPEQRIQAGELVLMPSIGGGYLMGCAGLVVDKHLASLAPYEETTVPFALESASLTAATISG